MWIMVCLPDRSIQIKLLFELWQESMDNASGKQRTAVQAGNWFSSVWASKAVSDFFFLSSQEVVISEIIVHNYCKVKRTDIHFYGCREIIKA